MAIAPIIYIFFNRPEATRESFSAIRAMRPARLHLIADGPRPDKSGEAERCEATRALVEAGIDWPCEVTRDYAIENLGAGRRISSGLTAAFEEHFEEAIILEDDLVPLPDFFPFCTAMLARHRNASQVHAISGFNPLGYFRPAGGASVPTLFNDSWGWATWRRAWSGYRFDISDWRDAGAREAMRRSAGNDLIFQHYARGFDEVLAGKVDAWDYQWTHMMFRERRHAITSSVNFITNIGFSQLATHTHTAPPWIRGLRAHAAIPTRRERDCGEPDRLHDHLYAEVIMSSSPMKVRLARAAARHAWLYPRVRR